MQKSSLQPKAIRRLPAIALLVIAAAIGVYAWTNSSLPTGGSGEARVGGPFQMVNHRGETVTEKTFSGKPLLLVFGFTFCPDICPTELQVTTEALAILGSKAADIQPLFVTVDPERDTPAILKDYLANFSPNLVGLTGSPRQVRAMADVYRVYFEKRPNKQTPEDYAMDHTSIIYLMDSTGKFRRHFSYTTDAQALARGIAAALER